MVHLAQVVLTELDHGSVVTPHQLCIVLAISTHLYYLRGQYATEVSERERVSECLVSC